MTPPTRIFAAIVVTMALACPHPLRGDEKPVSFRLSQSFGFAPLTLRVTARIPSHQDNVFLCFHIDDDAGDYATVDCQEHVGSSAPLQVIRTFPDLRTGKYTVWLVLHRRDNKSLLSGVQTLQVLESLPR